jgi:pantothenate synthetase
MIEKSIYQEKFIHKIDYISFASALDMTELHSEVSVSKGAVLSCAVRLGKVRLIDNILIGKAKQDLLH